jgi:small GTP-binding protein
VIKHCVIALGNTAVGKTAITNQFVLGSSPGEPQPTSGIDFFSMDVMTPKGKVRLQLCDTGGQEQCHSLIASGLHGATILILVYDITVPESFQDLDKWHSFALEHAKPVFFVIGNKIDLASERKVTTEDGKEWAAAHSAEFFETSAIDAMNIKELFNAIVRVPGPGVQE